METINIENKPAPANPDGATAGKTLFALIAILKAKSVAIDSFIASSALSSAKTLEGTLQSLDQLSKTGGLVNLGLTLILSLASGIYLGQKLRFGIFRTSFTMGLVASSIFVFFLTKNISNSAFGAYFLSQLIAITIPLTLGALITHWLKNRTTKIQGMAQ